MANRPTREINTGPHACRTKREAARQRAPELVLVGTATLLAAACIQTVPGAVYEQPRAEHAVASPNSERNAQATDGDPRAGIVLTWNLDWFGDPNEGPRDDAAQYAAVREVLGAIRPAAAALEEVADPDAFERLLRDLPAARGVLSGYSWVQKTGLIWNGETFELVSTRTLPGLEDAGRPPLVVRLRDVRTSESIEFVVIHAKADADRTSYDKRVAFARGLKQRLDAEPTAQSLVLLGDFNDLLQGSILDGAQSPYADFISDPAYAAPTLELDRPGAHEGSFAHGATIDHIVLRGAVASSVVASSVEVLRSELLDRYPDYLSTVSDHFPVSLALAF